MKLRQSLRVLMRTFLTVSDACGSTTLQITVFIEAQKLLMKPRFNFLAFRYREPEIYMSTTCYMF